LAVRVTGFDIFGNPMELECEDFCASLMQNEIDHLDGILTLNRANRAARQRAISALLSSTTEDVRLAASWLGLSRSRSRSTRRSFHPQQRRACGSGGHPLVVALSSGRQ